MSLRIRKADILSEFKSHMDKAWLLKITNQTQNKADWTQTWLLWFDINWNIELKKQIIDLNTKQEKKHRFLMTVY